MCNDNDHNQSNGSGMDQLKNNINGSKAVDKSQLLAIIHFLKKNELSGAEEALRKEVSNLISEDDIKSM